MAPIRCCFDQTAVWHSDAARGPSTPSFNHLIGAYQGSCFASLNPIYPLVRQHGTTSSTWRRGATADAASRATADGIVSTFLVIQCSIFMLSWIDLIA